MSTIATLSACTDFVLDGTHGSPERVEDGIPVLSARNIRAGRIDFSTDRFTTADEEARFKSRLSIAAGDVLLTIVGTIGRAAVVDAPPPPLVFQRSVAVIRPDEEKVLSRYLYHATQSIGFQAQLSRATNASSQAGVYLGKLKSLEIPLPPLEEQRRIAAILDKADELRAKRREAIAKLDTLAQSIFIDMFGDPVTNPMGWELSTIDSVCDLVRGSSPRPKADPKFYGGPVPRLMVADITRDGWSVTPKIDSLTVEGARYSRPIESGTVVMAVSGNVGLVSILAIDACIHDGFVAFKNLDQATILPNYLVVALHMLKQTHDKRRAGAIFQNLTTKDIKAMAIPVPPLRLQQELGDRLAFGERLAALLRRSDRSQTAFSASLEQRAFKGEL